MDLSTILKFTHVLRSPPLGRRRFHHDPRRYSARTRTASTAEDPACPSSAPRCAFLAPRFFMPVSLDLHPWQRPCPSLRRGLGLATLHRLRAWPESIFTSQLRRACPWPVLRESHSRWPTTGAPPRPCHSCSPLLSPGGLRLRRSSSAIVFLMVVKPSWQRLRHHRQDIGARSSPSRALATFRPAQEHDRLRGLHPTAPGRVTLHPCQAQHPRFIHLRTHTEHSLLEGAVPVKKLVDLCKAAQNMPAVAVTDTNNMFAALEFSVTATRRRASSPSPAARSASPMTPPSPARNGLACPRIHRALGPGPKRAT